MNKITLIIKREYLTRVRKKLFLITTILTPVGFGILIFSSVFLSMLNTDKKEIGVIDKSNLFKNQLQSDKSIVFSYIDADYVVAKKDYKERGVDGLLYITPNGDKDSTVSVEYFSQDQLGFKAESDISEQMTKIMRRTALSRLNLTPELIDGLSKDVEIKSIVMGEEGEKEGNTGIATALGYVMGFAIYIVMLVYGTQVMKGVLEEKTSRIAEVVISSVKPFQLMMGKIIGIGLVGLTQFLIWIILGVLIQFVIGIFFGEQLMQAQQSGMQMQGQMQGPEINKLGKIMESAASLTWVYLISCFLFYFLGGYFLYASLFAAVGAASGDEGDQSLTFIVMLPVIASIILMTNALQDPNGTLAVVASMIPFSAPIIMCARLPFDPPLWQVAISMVSLIAGFVFTTWLAGKIYRVGILMYGKKVTVKELGKWLMYKN